MDSGDNQRTGGHGSVQRQNEEPLHRLVLHVVAVVHRLSSVKQQVTGTFDLHLTWGARTGRVHEADSDSRKMFHGPFEPTC